MDIRGFVDEVWTGPGGLSRRDRSRLSRTIMAVAARHGLSPLAVYTSVMGDLARRVPVALVCRQLEERQQWWTPLSQLMAQLGHSEGRQIA